MTRIGLKIKFLGIATCFAVVLALIGCSDNTGPVAPAEWTVGDVVPSPNFVRILPAAKDGTQLEMNSYVEQPVSASLGGTVANGRVTLEIPPGALSEDTMIRMEMDETGLYITDLGPEGIQFAVPVTLTFDLVGTSSENDAANTFIAWFNESAGYWEYIENLPPPDANTIQGILHHFSKYSGVGG